MTPVDIAGWIGATCLAVSALPQTVKSVREGHSSGISHGTLWLWVIGEMSISVYTWFKLAGDPALMFNYAFNLALVLGIAKYKYFPRKSG